MTGRTEQDWRTEAWLSLGVPAWLGADAPQGDVVLSTRCRLMRNLRGHRFPHSATLGELSEIQLKVISSAPPQFEVLKNLSGVERDYLVACRLLSPDYDWSGFGRAVLLDSTRTLSLMINEEDHLRLQALSPGWSLNYAEEEAHACLRALESHLDFAWSPAFGYLSASPYNAGTGKRLSAMFHLIGLAHSRRLPQLLKALASQGVVVRGLFGELSRAVGAFVQISVQRGANADFVGACDYVMRTEREARAEISHEEIGDRFLKARDFAISSRSLRLDDALRVLAWWRWAAVCGIVSTPYRQIDLILTRLELRGATEESAAIRRAKHLREALEKG